MNPDGPVDVAGWWAWFSALDHGAIANQMFVWLLLLAGLGMLFRLGTILKIIVGIKEARSPIWDLRGTVDQLHKMEPVIKDLKNLEPLIRRLGEDVPLLFAKVDATNRQLTELQLESVSNRTDDQGSEGQFERNGQGNATSDDHWEELRNYWRRNTQRIEAIIESIQDGRTRLSFDRMLRTNYKAIIDKLEAGNHISKADANASRDLIILFNSYRPRNKKVLASDVEPLALVDQQLDRGLISIERIGLAEGESTRGQRSSNQGAGFFPVNTSTQQTRVPTDNSVAHQKR